MTNIIEDAIADYEDKFDGKLPDEQKAFLYARIEALMDDYAEGITCECDDEVDEKPAPKPKAPKRHAGKAPQSEVE